MRAPAGFAIENLQGDEPMRKQSYGRVLLGAVVTIGISLSASWVLKSRTTQGGSNSFATPISSGAKPPLAPYLVSAPPPRSTALTFNPDRHEKAGEFAARALGYGIGLRTDEIILRPDGPLVETRGNAVFEQEPVRLKFIRTNPYATLVSARDPSKPVDDSRIAKIVGKSIYQGIDVTYAGDHPELTYVFSVAPGADPKAIQLEVMGAATVATDALGNLVLETAKAKLTQSSPTAWQTVAGARKEVATTYEIHGSQVSFHLDAYDGTQPLTITAGRLMVVGTSATNHNVFPAATSAGALGYPDPRGCSSTPPPINPGTQAGFPGLWWDANRYGTGWEVHFVPAGVYLTWLTYDAQHRPIWLSSGGVVSVSQTDPVTLVQEYSVPLYRPTWVPGTTRGVLGLPVGQAAIAFKSGTQVAAAIRWQWDDVSAAPQVDECIYDYFHAPSGSGPILGPLDESYNGAWYSPSSSGWGLFPDIGTNNGATSEIETAAIYDTAGNTVWLQGVNSGQPQTGAQSVNLDYAQSSASGYPNGFPTTSCSGSSCLSVTNNVGTLTRAFDTSQSGSVSAFAAAVDATTTGSDAISWPNAPVTYPTNIAKLSETTVVLVNQTPCVIPAGQSTCKVTVSWATTDSTARVFRREVQYQNTGLQGLLEPVPIASTSSGSLTVTLGPSSDVQFEMYSGTDDGTVPSGTPAFISAEVYVPSGGTPASLAPNAPSSVTATIPTGTGLQVVPISWVPDAGR